MRQFGIGVLGKGLRLTRLASWPVYAAMNEGINTSCTVSISGTPTSAPKRFRTTPRFSSNFWKTLDDTSLFVLSNAVLMESVEIAYVPLRLGLSDTCVFPSKRNISWKIG